MRVGGGCLRDSIRREPLRACANHLLGLHLLVELYFRDERALRLRAPHSRSPETSMVPNESRSILVVAIALCATITSSRPLPRPGCCHRLFRSAVRPSLPALSTSLPACSAGPSGFWQPGTKLRSIAAATALNANLGIVFIGMPLSQRMGIGSLPCVGRAFLLQRSCWWNDYLAIRVPITSTSTRRSGCRQAITLALLLPSHSPVFVTGCVSPLPSVRMRFGSIPLLTK